MAIVSAAITPAKPKPGDDLTLTVKTDATRQHHVSESLTIDGKAPLTFEGDTVDPVEVVDAGHSWVATSDDGTTATFVAKAPASGDYSLTVSESGSVVNASYTVVPPGARFCSLGWISGGPEDSNTANNLRLLPMIKNGRFYHTPGDLPATFQKSTNGEALATKYGIDAVVSFKPDITGSISGAHDDWMTNYAKSCPAGTVIIIQHEPENKSKGIAPADFVAANNRLLGLAKEANSKILTCIDFMEYQWEAGGDKDAYMDVDPSVVDVVGIDAYNSMTRTPDNPKAAWRTGEQLVSGFFTQAAAKYPDAKLAVVETGTLADPNGKNIRSTWLLDFMAWFQKTYGAKAFYVAWFDSKGNWDWRLSDAEKTAIAAGLSS